MALLNIEIDNIEVALRPFMQHALYSELQANLRDGLSVYNRGVQKKKESKFWRDKTAFSEGRVYKCNTHIPRNKKNKHYVSQQQSNNMNSISKYKNGPSSSRDPKTPHKGRGKFKRSHNNRGSPEQDRKKMHC